MSNPAPKIGQIWTPRVGGKHPKIVLTINGSGGVHAAKYPRQPNTYATYFRINKWDDWVNGANAEMTEVVKVTEVVAIARWGQHT